MTAHFVNLLEEIRRRSLRMASLVEDMLLEACESVFAHNAMLADRVIQRDEEVDDEEVQVEQEVIRLLALYQPVGSDLRLLCTILKVNNDFERIADCAVNIAERASYHEVQDLAQSSLALKQMCPAVQGLLRDSIKAYGMQDAETAMRVIEGDEAIDVLYSDIIKTCVAEVSESNEQIAAQLDKISVAKNLERIADHAINIAEDVIFLSTGKIVRHTPGLKNPEDVKNMIDP